MPKETMTPKERWLAVLTRKKPDRVPMDYWGTPETGNALKKHFKADDLQVVMDKLKIDNPLCVGGRYAGPKIPGGLDIWGHRSRKVNYGTGSYDEIINAPLEEFKTVEEIKKNYQFPKNDWWDYKHLPKEIKGKEHRIIRAGGSEPFLRYKTLRGEVQAFVDLIENPDIVNYVLGKLYDFAYEDTRRIYEAIPGMVKISYVAEDLGGQEDLMYSPDHIKEFFFPHMRRMVKLVHDAGAFAFNHTDGAVRKILPGLIEVGIDVLNPIQWRCKGMEREGLKKDFGSKLIFHGAVDNQQTLPFGTVEDVKKEVIDNLKILGAGGGYILAPCHNIQPVTPVANIIAMYETGLEHGWTK